MHNNMVLLSPKIIKQDRNKINDKKFGTSLYSNGKQMTSIYICIYICCHTD